jgi:N-acyl homoserine lactone hydrolase
MSSPLMRVLAAAALLVAVPAASAATDPAPVAVSRIDCGTIDIDDLGAFSDTGLYQGVKKQLVASCYLVRHGDQYLLWDTGIDGALAGKGKDKEGSFLARTIVDQLAQGGVKPGDIDYVGISHYHYDHTGQLANFPDATLLEGKADWEIVKVWKPAEPRYRHWLTGGGKVDLIEGDKDVFGDGSVTIIDLPGHTEGHHGLLVKLASGPVLISGDEYHFTENRAVGGVPSFNTNRAETLASHDRFEKLAANLRAKVVIQHEPADVAKLPAFPAFAQ